MPNITKITGPNPGKTIAIFSGIHGNEKAGIVAVRKLKEELNIKRGTVYLVEANPPAMTVNKRYLNKNLNRLFVRGLSVETYEDAVAKTLMNLLDECDALLDLHSYNDDVENRTVFAICENHCLEAVSDMDVPIAITGFTYMQEGGTDGYMNSRGKIGVCVELGSVNIAEEMSVVGMTIAKQFLGHFGVISEEEPAQANKRVLHARMMYRKNTDAFRFIKEYKTFDIIPPNTTFATDGTLELKTDAESVILFPSTDYPTGIEAFILAEETQR